MTDCKHPDTFSVSVLIRVCRHCHLNSSEIAMAGWKRTQETCERALRLCKEISAEKDAAIAERDDALARLGDL